MEFAKLHNLRLHHTFQNFKTIQQYSGSSHQQIKQDFHNVVQLVI